MRSGPNKSRAVSRIQWGWGDKKEVKRGLPVEASGLTHFVVFRGGACTVDGRWLTVQCFRCCSASIRVFLCRRHTAKRAGGVGCQAALPDEGLWACP